MTEQAEQPYLFNGSQLSALIDRSPEVSEALTDLTNKCLFTDELVVVQLQTQANLDLYQDYFIDGLDDSFDVVTVNAHMLMSTEELFDEIVHQAEIDVEPAEIQDAHDRLGLVLGQFIEELKADSAELVLQVNFAHELSAGVLNDLMKLTGTLRDHGAFHLVLWMDIDSATTFEKRITALNLEFSVIEILRFTAANINEYLKFVFASNGRPFALTKEDVKQVIVGSGGEAELVDQLAGEAMEQSQPKAGGAGRAGRKKKDEYLLLKSMVAVAVTALVIMFLLPEDESEEQLTDDETSASETQQAERIVIDINRDEQAIDSDETVFTPPVVAELPDAESGNSISPAQVENPDTETREDLDQADPEFGEAGPEVVGESATDDTEDVESLTPPEPGQEEIAVTGDSSEPVTEAVDATVSVPEPPAVIEVEEDIPEVVELSAYEAQLQELLSHQDNEAFIQVLGTYDEGVAQRFIADNEIDRSFYYARTDLNGRDWFVVLYGSFVSERAAINALDTLPANMRDSGAWVRNMRNIRSTIE